MRASILVAAVLWFGCNEPDLVPDAGSSSDSGMRPDSGQRDGGSSNDGGVVSELCPAGSTLLQFSLTAPNPVPTADVRITSLAIQDSSAELSSTEQQRFEFLTKEEVDSVLNYRWNHHNGCDSFHLGLAHAEYAATASPLAPSYGAELASVCC